MNHNKHKKPSDSSMVQQKTNEDFNKITPQPDDPGFKKPIKDPTVPVIENGEELSHEEALGKAINENDEKKTGGNIY